MGKRVAFFQTGIESSIGGGGAGRFFIEIYNAIYLHGYINDKIYFITDSISHRKFSKANFFNSGTARKRFLFVTVFNSRLKNLLEGLDFLTKVIFYRLELIHICQYYRQDCNHRINSLKWLPAFIRPKVVVNFVHCNFPYEYFDETHPHSKIFHERFETLFNELRVDGVFSWYDLFCSFVREHKLFKYEPYLYSIKHYCCNTDKFKPSEIKEDMIVFASRLDDQKNPLMFLEAVKKVALLRKETNKEWKFLLCGRGPLQEKVVDFIKFNQLEDWIDLKHDVADLSTIFGISKCYISTQKYENFTSLSMNEAMASGNAIISRNVGQTELYVRDGYNGFLLEEDTSDNLAEKIIEFINAKDIQERFMQSSIKIVKEIHNQKNFVNELDLFWTKIISLKK